MQTHLSIGTVGLLGFLNNRPDDDTLGKGSVETKRIFVRAELLMWALPMHI